MEKHLERTVQWLVCLLHANELPLRHLIEKLDGPNVFSGPIGSSLTGCEELPIIKYVRVELNN